MITIGTPLKPADTGWPEMVRLRDLTRAEIVHGSGEHPIPISYGLRRAVGGPRNKGPEV